MMSSLTAPVAQLDRALPSEGKGHTFESCRVRHSATFHDIVVGQDMNAVSSRRQPHVKLAARRLGITQERLGARQRLAAFKSGDRGLAGPHPGS